jgi:2'-hydroxyisoflavone reductase
MRILVIGGTVFVGRAIVDAAVAAGHEVTRFHRGKTTAEAPGAVETILGDRDGGLDALAGRTWDAVIDTCGYVPRLVRASAEFLRKASPRYVFVSTVSVYADFDPIGLDESSALGELEDPATETIDAATYGPLKVLCERAVTDVYGEHSLIARPGIIVGPHDPTDRFTYWMARIAAGATVLAPGSPDAAMQFLDARDLAAWLVAATERDERGVFNTVGPATPTTWGEVLFACCEAAERNVRVRWIPDEFLLENGVQAWRDLPLWLPPSEGKQGLFRIDASRAHAAGLSHRSTAAIVRDTMQWWRTRENAELSVGIAPERAAEILAAWDTREAGATS